jgi:hypothetical protein
MVLEHLAFMLGGNISGTYGKRGKKNNGSSSFSMDKMIFNSRPRWFL